MVFLNNIPQPTDNLDFSQGQLLANNQQLDTTMGVDHYRFSDGTINNGKHNQSTYVRKAAKPVVAGTDVAVYSKLVGSLSQLFFEDQNGVEYQISGASSNAAVNGYTTLFNGIIVNWGFSLITPAANTVINFPVGLFTNVFSVVITPVINANVTDSTVYLKTFNAVQFIARNSTASAFSITWIAIGN